MSFTQQITDIWNLIPRIEHALGHISGRLDTLMANVDDLNTLALSLRDKVLAETAAITEENAKIDQVVSLLRNAQGQTSPDLNAAIALLTEAKTNIDSSTSAIADESSKLDKVVAGTTTSTSPAPAVPATPEETGTSVPTVPPETLT